MSHRWHATRVHRKMNGYPGRRWFRSTFVKSSSRRFKVKIDIPVAEKAPDALQDIYSAEEDQVHNGANPVFPVFTVHLANEGLLHNHEFRATSGHEILPGEEVAQPMTPSKTIATNIPLTFACLLARLRSDIQAAVLTSSASAGSFWKGLLGDFGRMNRIQRW
ncbi:hypothetical protein B0H19DRAFT_1080904 [Mycena capillaripes]|nr:hypothetical protein B0H19DRAFT_1080904 [Mycena capillaripes]